jgi:hypothetical protein
MRVQVAHPGRHAVVAEFPFERPLAEWDQANLHPVLGLHRHEVKLLEYGDVSYVVKELPDDLALREYRLLRELDEEGLPTVEAVAAVTDRPNGEGLIITRHLDYSLPYRSLLMGRGLKIPYLGDRLLDALVVLLVRIHLAGFFWGDCSLSNTLFRRDAGALQAYIIDVETAERHDELTDGQRELDLMIATDNVAGGLLDLQAAGRLADDIDPIAVALAIEDRYKALLAELTGETSAPRHDMGGVRERLDRLHQLGFDVEEMEFVTDDNTESIRIVPKVVEHGYHSERLTSLTGLVAGENQARRMLEDIHQFGAELQRRTGQSLPENIVAVRWLDQRFEPTIAAIPRDLLNRLQAAEIFHQLLEHQWYMSEQAPPGTTVTLEEALSSYLALLAEAPPERLHLSTDELDEELAADLAALAETPEE